jgi:hypothetical protein
VSAIETIEKALRSGVLISELVRVPAIGATESELVAEESSVGRTFSPQFRALLRRWNGINLDVLRFYGCKGAITSAVREVQFSELSQNNLLGIGSDPSGFAYCEDQKGAVCSFDTDGGDISYLARDLDDFIARLVFGSDSELFGGPDWADKLKKAGF